jgi:quercetin dioxygenase-like cupin family protein
VNRRPSIAIIGLLALGALAAAVGHPTGTEPEPPAAEGTRVVLENDRVRAHRIDYPAGTRSERHTHAHPRVVVVLEGGTLEVRADDGAARTFRLRAGDVVWRPAETHALVNTGATTVRLIEIDLLD